MKILFADDHYFSPPIHLFSYLEEQEQITSEQQYFDLKVIFLKRLPYGTDDNTLLKTMFNYTNIC